MEEFQKVHQDFKEKISEEANHNLVKTLTKEDFQMKIFKKL